MPPSSLNVRYAIPEERLYVKRVVKKKMNAETQRKRKGQNKRQMQLETKGDGGG